MTIFRRSLFRLIFALVGAPLMLASCGGGGGGGGGGASTPVTPTNPSSWTSGVFQAASQFKNKCAAVRTGVDIEGNAFPDRAGTAVDEKNWLRSWTRETYLWNTEVTDRNPASADTRTEYFGFMRTNALTASGKFKDDFHFSEPTAEYLARRNSAASASYGAQIVILSGSVPRDVRVVYTEPNSPASELQGGVPKLQRGTRLLSVNGIDLVYGGVSQAEIDILNNGTFPSTANVTTTFTVQDPGAVSARTITLTSTNLVEKPVNRTEVLNTPSGKVGYILFNTFSPFSSESDIVAAMQSMQTENVSDLVLDLRYNGGGLLAVASQVSYMIAGNTRTTGRTFERLRFNSAAGNLNPVTGEVNNPVPFYNTGLGFSVASGTPLPNLNLPRVFVLTTENTCSASEAVINGLRGIGVEVILIGGKTCGKPYGFYPTDNCGETYYTIQFQGVNDANFGDYADGFIPNNSSQAYGVRVPGCVAADDFTNELGDADEGLLATALTYRATSACPSFASGAGSRSADGGVSLAQSSIATPRPMGMPQNKVMKFNRDMTRPQ